MSDGLIEGADGRRRCWWCGYDALYMGYHDQEWGRPQRDNHRLFEKICLEGFQAGLSWLTILRKRENFRYAFAGFDYNRVAGFGESEVDTLLGDAGIVRHRGKIESVINNARQAIEMEREFGSLIAYFEQFRPGSDERPRGRTHAELAPIAKTRSSMALSKDLKKRGWSFVGPTTCYAFMQAMGLVDDHIEGCWVRGEIAGSQ